MLLTQGRLLLEAWLSVLEDPDPPESMLCACGAQARYQFRREAALLTVLCRVTYERAYYPCPECHGGPALCINNWGLQPGPTSA